jgi:hypothetical protein
MYDRAKMPSFNRLVLTKQLVNRQHNGGSIPCHGKNCDRALRIGDTVYAHYQQRHPSAKTVYYCLECYEGLWI